MARTAQLDLPLVMPAQAQKHVTVNEAFARLDAVAQLRVVSSTTATPPGSAVEGVSFLIPQGATGAWQSRSGEIAIWSNGGWIFLQPKAGWRAFDEGRAGYAAFDGTDWIADATAVAPGGSASLQRIVEFDHAIIAGTENLTGVTIPAGAQVTGVTGRVIAPLSGSGLVGWRLGVQGSDNRYGSGLGLGLNSYLLGLTGSPVTYYSDTPLLVSGEGGSFTGGTIRLALHLTELAPARAI